MRSLLKKILKYNMKYILKKKWHPSQVEEVGHMFEEDKDDYRMLYPESIHNAVVALLCEAGYLEKQEETGKVFNYGGNFFCGNPEPHSHLVHGKTFECEKGQPQLEKEQECTCSAKQVNYQVLHMPSCSMITPEQKPDPQLDLWTEKPPEGKQYWFINHYGEVDDDYFYKARKTDLFRLKTKNCHRTQKSAEEALKNLMSE